MGIVILISIPMYICATASTPIAAGLILSGVSPGAALVFMLAGPATNIATLMVVKKELGSTALAAYLTGVVVTALVMGLGFDFVLEFYGVVLKISHGDHGEMTSWLYQISAILLALLIAWQYLKKIRH